MTNTLRSLEVGTKIIQESTSSQNRKTAINSKDKNPIQNPQVSFGFANKPNSSKTVIKIGTTHRGNACKRTNNGALTLAIYF